MERNSFHLSSPPFSISIFEFSAVATWANKSPTTGSLLCGSPCLSLSKTLPLIWALPKAVLLILNISSSGLPLFWPLLYTGVQSVNMISILSSLLSLAKSSCTASRTCFLNWENFGYCSSITVPFSAIWAIPRYSFSCMNGTLMVIFPLFMPICRSRNRYILGVFCLLAYRAIRAMWWMKPWLMSNAYLATTGSIFSSTSPFDLSYETPCLV